MKPKFVFNDGGRADAGYKGFARDCVTRSIAIVSGRPYKTVYRELAELNKKTPRKSRSGKIVYKHAGKRSARNGIHTRTKLFENYMKANGFVWTPTTAKKGVFGFAKRVRKEDFPQGKYILELRGHYTVMIDGVLHDNHDCSHDGLRYVHGYWKIADENDH